MELVESWIEALAMLTEPFWLTLSALAGMIAAAGAGTAFVGVFLLILSLDLLRSSRGIMALIARLAAAGSTVFIISSFVYGDFLSAPAKAAYSAIIARAPVVPSPVVALGTIGAASVGAIFYAGRLSGAHSAGSFRSSVSRRLIVAHSPGAFALTDLSKALTLDAAGRLQLRQLARNPRKSMPSVRPAARANGRMLR